MGKKKDPMIYEVAEHSGISISIVSHVLNNSKIRASAQIAIDERGFIPKLDKGKNLRSKLLDPPVDAHRNPNVKYGPGHELIWSDLELSIEFESRREGFAFQPPTG